MSTRYVAAALCAAVVACGGSSSGGSTTGANAARGATFNYGAGATATPTQAAVVNGTLDSTLALSASGSPDATAAVGFAGFSGLTDALLGASGASFLAAPGPGPAALAGDGLAAAHRNALTSGFDPACITSSATSVTYRNCQIVVTGSTSITETWNGTFSFSADLHTMTWDLTLHVAFTGQLTGVDDFHESGTVTVTADTIKGNMLAELSGTNGGTSFALSEAVLLDVTYQTSPVACVTGGTLEVKRVWTNAPAGFGATNRGAKVTWTGCDTMTIALST